MAGIVVDLQRIYVDAKSLSDPRTRHWLLVENSPWPVWTLTAVYLSIVAFGPLVMRHQKPIDLKWFLIVYNLGLVGLSSYMMVEIMLSVLNANYDLQCAAYNMRDSPMKAAEMRVASILWWYFISKAVELMDTVLMVLRRKDQQVTFLHIFHHSSMLNIWWWTIMYIPGGQSWFGAWVNCLVHVPMYTYYGLSSLPSMRGKLWWKRYITRLQLLQFFITFTHTINSIRIGCDFPRWGQFLLSGYMVTMIVLFGNFYMHAYVQRGKLRASNGVNAGGAVGNSGTDLRSAGKQD